MCHGSIKKRCSKQFPAKHRVRSQKGQIRWQSKTAQAHTFTLSGSRRFRGSSVAFSTRWYRSGRASHFSLSYRCSRSTSSIFVAWISSQSVTIHCILYLHKITSEGMKKETKREQLEYMFSQFINAVLCHHLPHCCWKPVTKPTTSRQPLSKCQR